MFIDIDSLLRPVYGHAKQGASYGHTKIAGKQILRKGLSPLATTISTDRRGAGDRRDAAARGQDRLRQGRRADGRPGDQHRPRRRRQRADPGPRRLGLRQPHGGPGLPARGRPVLAGDDPQPRRADRAIAAIDDDAWTPVSYPGAVRDPDTGAWISDAEVAEIAYTAFASTKDRDHRPTGRAPRQRRPLSRRVVPGLALSPVLHQHRPVVTDADITHRQHAVIETVFADLIDGPLAHIPSGRFGANSAWILCAAIAHNLLRAAGVLAGGLHRAARAATLRRKIVNIPARLARPQRRPVLHLPSHWPWQAPGLRCGTTPSDTARHYWTDLTTRRPGPTGDHRKSWTDQQHPTPIGRSIKLNQQPTRNQCCSMDRGLVKGLEYDHVIIANADLIGHHKHLYVAMTRPRKTLTILSASPVIKLT